MHTKLVLLLVATALAPLPAPEAAAQRRIPARVDPLAQARRWLENEWAALGLEDLPGRHRLMDIARDYHLTGYMRALAREILALDPDHREAHRHLGHTLYKGRWLDAEAAQAAGLVRFDYTFPVGYPSPQKDGLLFPIYLTAKQHKQHLKHQNWTTCWIIKRKPLTLHTNCTRQKAEAFARSFQAFARDVTRYFGLPLRSHYEINIFRSRQEYFSIGRAPAGSGGFYSPGHRKLYFYDDPRDQISTYRVLFHEGTHMIVHLTCKNKAFHYPICINEGLAEYMGSARWDYRRQRYTFGHPLNDRIKTFKGLLAAGRAKPLKELVLHPRRGFGGAEYAQAWALITYLADVRVGHSPKRLGLYLKRLFEDNKYKMLADGEPRKVAAMAEIFERTFFNEKDGTSWKAFQDRFWAYARTMKEEVGAPDFSRRYLRRLLGR